MRAPTSRIDSPPPYSECQDVVGARTQDNDSKDTTSGFELWGV